MAEPEPDASEPDASWRAASELGVVEFSNGAITLRLAIDAEGRVRIVNLGPSALLAADTAFAIALGPVEVQFSGDELPQGSRHVALGGTARLRYRSHEVTEDPAHSAHRAHSALVLTQADDRGIRIETTFTILTGVPVIRCRSRIVNESAHTMTLEYVSSLSVSGLANWADPLHPDPLHPDPLSIAIPHNGFCAEFQWSTHSLTDLGLRDLGFRADGVHSSTIRISAGSTGTQPTTEHLPMGVLTDTERGVSWGWQIEHNGAWHWEVGEHRTGISLCASGPTEREHQWLTSLAPGDAFDVVPASIAAVVGGPEAAFAPLTLLRRDIRRPHNDNVALPVVFNDYMNSVLADPTEEVLLPLIAAAATVGSEYYCIDAGWYSDEPGWWDSVGAWTESTARFPHGLAHVTDVIRSHSMVPGLWIEPEVVGVRSPIARELPPDAFFTRGGSRVDAAGRHQLDFRHPAVIARMDGVVDRLITDYGLGYLKFDYNINGGGGTDVACDSPGDGLLGHNRAYLAWVDGVLDRHPGLVIEACASGGGRLDHATLARHSIASTSDQTDHLRTVPIAAGAPTGITPEQAAVWVCPQPGFSDDELDLCLVTGMLARPQLSGRMAALSPRQLGVVASAVAVYTGYREWIPRSVPVWPLGLPGCDDDWIAQGLETSDGASGGCTLLLAVWRRGAGSSPTLAIPFPRWAGRDFRYEVLFPTHATAPVWTGDALAVTLPRSPSAVLLRLIEPSTG
ncbi:MAG: alpha-galactosidase [Burkholderiaceae bacterium]|nr:alpha-galactosidase [Microbacteriaceae bacterium]